MIRIYVSLDEIFDTRLGFISQQEGGQALLEKWLHPENNEYSLRMHDSFLWEALGWDEKTWRERWNARDEETLKRSIITHCLKNINHVAMKYRRSTEEALSDLAVELHVDTHPYRLEEYELSTLKDSLEDELITVDKIEFVNIGINRLTPAVIKGSYQYLFLYDFHYWMSLHVKEARESMLVNSYLFVPKLFNELPNEEMIKGDKEIQDLLKLDLFKILETVLATKFKVVFIAAAEFGVILKPIPTSKSPQQDLDSLGAPSAVYTHDNSLFDPQ